MANALIDNFESYSTGNLNGQGSWSGDTHFQVEISTVFSGTNAVSCGPASGAGIGTASYTANASGTQYFYWRVTDTNCKAATNIRRGSPSFTEIGVVGWGLRASTGTLDIWDQTGAHYVDTGFTVAADTWYPFAIQWDIGNSRYRCSIDGGVTWCAYATVETAQNVANTAIFAPNTVGTSYWDDFSDTAPVTTNIKSWDGLAYASVSKINGLATASIKNINGLT